MMIRRHKRARRSALSGEVNREHNRPHGNTTVYDLSGFTFSSPVNIYFDSASRGWVSPGVTSELIISSHNIGDGNIGATIRFLIVSLVDGTVIPYKAAALNEDMGNNVLSNSWPSNHRYDQGMGDGFVGMAHPYPTSSGGDIGAEITLSPVSKAFPPCVLLVVEKDTVGLGQVSPLLSPGDGHDFSPNCDDYVSVRASNNKAGVTGFNDQGAWTSDGGTGTDYYVESQGGAGPYGFDFMVDVPGYIGSTAYAEYSFDSSC